MAKINRKKHDSKEHVIKRWRVSEYVPTGKGNRLGFEAAFLETVSRLVPELVSSLRLEALPVFKALEALANEATDPAVAANLRRQYEFGGGPLPILGIFGCSNIRISERRHYLRINWAALCVPRSPEKSRASRSNIPAGTLLSSGFLRSSSDCGSFSIRN